MSRAVIGPELLQRVGVLLLERVGLKSTPDGQSGLRLALLARLEAKGLTDPASYVDALEGDAQGDELRALLPLVTVGKTDFFRDPHQFRALRQRVLPEEIHRARSEGRKLRIWSAGCATGEEPYSLAMLAMELGILPAELEILATDVNPAALEYATQAVYPVRRMAGLTDEQLTRFFVPRGAAYEVTPAVRAYVRFEQQNLAGAAFPQPQSGGVWDLILCRNVIIYFDGETIARILTRFDERLREGGYLCLGYSESLYRLATQFSLVEIEGAFLYRKQPPKPKVDARARAEEVVSRLRAEVDERRREVIRGARTLGDRKPAPPAVRPTPVREVPAPRPAAAAAPAARVAVLAPPTPASVPLVGDPVAAAARLSDSGEFGPALAVLQEAFARTPGNLAIPLSLGNLCTVMGRRDEARAAYQAALAIEPLCAEAHLCLGICDSDAPGLDAEAQQALTRAVFLDPHLALAHYYLGRLSERRGDKAGARRAYRNAIAAVKDQRGRPPLLGHYPDLPAEPTILSRAAQYALAALEEA